MYTLRTSYTDIKNQTMNLNNGDKYKACCGAVWVPAIKTHCCM